jgi:hypothetical protein
VRLEGTLDAFSLPDIFQLLSFTKKTGALHLRRVEGAGVVYFAAGSVTGASSADGRTGLARRIVGAGVTSDDALAAGVERAVGDGRVGVAAALRDAGAVDEGTLHAIVGEHTVDSVFDLLRWPDGEFAFVVDESNPDDLGILLAVDEVVAEARRRLDAWSTVSRVVPSPDAIPALVAAPGSDPVVSREEWALLGLVDGRRRVADVVALTGGGEYGVVSSLAALVERGLVTVGSGENDPASAAARRLRLLARLGAAEPEPAAVPAPSAAPAEPAASVPTSMPTSMPTSVPTSAPAVVAPPSVPAQPAPTAVPAGAGVAPEASVTPVRSEPFLPRRVPDHADDHAVNAAALPRPVGHVLGSAAVATAPATATVSSIERDPSVNKSLLLRLIAGVRGL